MQPKLQASGSLRALPLSLTQSFLSMAQDQLLGLRAQSASGLRSCEGVTLPLAWLDQGCGSPDMSTQVKRVKKSVHLGMSHLLA